MNRHGSELRNMERDIEKVEDLYRAFARGNLKAILLAMGKDVEIIQSPELPWGGRYSGHEGARRFLNVLTEHLDSRVVVERLIDAGEHVVAVGRTVGKARATNLEFDVPVVHVWTFTGGQVSRFQSFIDNPTILAVLGG